MAAPVDPFPNFVPAALADGDQVDARFTTLYNALDRTKVGLDAFSIKNAIVVQGLLSLDAWQSVAFTAGSWSPNSLEFYKDPFGIVRFKPKRYAITNPGINTQVALLPAGYRPGVTSYLGVHNGNGTTGWGYYSLSVSTAGVVSTTAQGLASGTVLDLAFAEFRAEN